MKIVKSLIVAAAIMITSFPVMAYDESGSYFQLGYSHSNYVEDDFDGTYSGVSLSFGSYVKNFYVGAKIAYLGGATLNYPYGYSVTVNAYEFMPEVGLNTRFSDGDIRAWASVGLDYVLVVVSDYNGSMADSNIGVAFNGGLSANVTDQTFVFFEGTLRPYAFDGVEINSMKIGFGFNF